MKTKKFFCLAMVVLCVFSLILPATAARYASKSTKEYGMLRKGDDTCDIIYDGAGYFSRLFAEGILCGSASDEMGICTAVL